MSLLIQSSPKHCGDRRFRLEKLLNKKLLYAISTFISTILCIILLFYLILHPSNPHFSLKDTTISTLSFSSSSRINTNPLLNSTIQLTLLTQNPNSKVGVYYDNIRAYAVYKGQQITADSEIPPFYQGHQDASLISAELYGNNMPVAAGIGYEVARDQTAGKMVLSLRVDGELKWKVGSWVSGKYRFDVDCVALVGLGGGGGGDLLNSAQGNQCSINV